MIARYVLLYGCSDFIVVCVLRFVIVLGLRFGCVEFGLFGLLGGFLFGGSVSV